MCSEFRTVWAEPLTQFCQRVFENMGVPAQDALTTTDVLVLADLRGIESHGVARLRRYYTGLKNGVMVPKPNIQSEKLFNHGSSAMLYELFTGAYEPRCERW